MTILGPEWQRAECTNCGWRTEWDAFGRYTPWPSHGEDACNWIEQNVILGEGDSYGEHIELRSDQVEFVYEWYSYCPECYWWRFSEFIRGEGRGGGKTQFAAALAALELSGPSWLSPNSPNICVAAASFEQANLLFSQLGIVYGGPYGEIDTPLNGKCNVLEKRIDFVASGRPGKAFRVAAKAGTNEGGQPTLLLADETHEWGDVGDPKARLYTVLSLATSKRMLRYVMPDGTRAMRGPGRSGMISTAGFDVNHSMLGAAYKVGREARKNPTLAPRLLFDWREAREGIDWTDPVQREIGVRDASGAAGIIWDVKQRVNKWGDPTIASHEYIRYFGNNWVDVAEDSWLVDYPAAWPSCKDEALCARVIAANDTQGIVAVDMALRHDSVGVCTLRHDPISARTVVHPRRFVADSSGSIDHVAVWRYIKNEADHLGENLRGIVYDPRFFELPARLLEDEGYELVQFDQNPARMAPACGKVFELIKAGLMAHPDEYPLNSAVLTAARREQDNGTFTLSKGRSKSKIDLCIAMVMGTWVLEQLLSIPADKPFNIY